MESSKYQFIIEDEEAFQRLDKYLVDALKNITRSQLQKLIKSGAVLVNGSVQSAGYKLRPGDKLIVTVSLQTDDLPRPEPIPLDIIYEDHDVIVINKEKGIVVHSGSGITNGTLVNALLYHCNGALSRLGDSERPGVVHRIDKDTTGLLVFAKTDTAYQSLVAQFKDHSIKRKYLAIICGEMKNEEYTIDLPIGRDKHNRTKMGVREDGKKAISYFRVMERFSQYTLIMAQLQTGRTHQIRVHAQYIGHPVLGDLVYGSKKKSGFRTHGQQLHAFQLGFLHPKTKKEMIFEKEPPEEFLDILRRLRAE